MQLKPIPVESLAKPIPVESLAKSIPVESLAKSIPVESLAKPIRNLPREIQILIYSFTSEFARRYARHLGFKNFGSINNEVFTDNYFKVIETLDIYSAQRLWKIECKFQKIIQDKQKFFKNKKRLPSLQHSYNSSSDFKEKVYPDFHESDNNLWAVNSYKKLVSYCLRVTTSGYYTILLIKTGHMDIFRTLFTKRIVDHHMRTHIDKYIVYYTPNLKEFDRRIKKYTTPRIICVPYDYKKIIHVKQYMELLRINNIKSYVISPESSNLNINGLLEYYSNEYSNGSGTYKIRADTV